MLNKYCKLILGTMLGVSTLAFSAGGASAAAMLPLSPVASGDVNAVNDGIIQITHRKGDIGHVMQWNGNRRGVHCRYYNNCRSRFRGHFYQTPYWTLPLIIGGGFGTNTYYDRYYDDDYGYDTWSNSHVRWCLNRYRSYNPRTNTWVSYSGRVRRCYSPF